MAREVETIANVLFLQAGDFYTLFLDLIRDRFSKVGYFINVVDIDFMCYPIVIRFFRWLLAMSTTSSKSSSANPCIAVITAMRWSQRY